MYDVEKFESFVNKVIETDGAKGLGVTVFNAEGEVLYEKCFGYRDAEKGLPYDADTIPASGHWFSDDTDDKDIARPGKGYPTPLVSEGEPLAGFSSVSVASNATLRAIGYVELGRLEVDASGVENGTLEGFTLAKSGILSVVGVAALSGDTSIPLSFSGCNGLENVSRWQVVVGGVPTNGYRAKASHDAVSVYRVGTMVYIK